MKILLFIFGVIGGGLAGTAGTYEIHQVQGWNITSDKLEVNMDHDDNYSYKFSESINQTILKVININLNYR